MKVYIIGAGRWGIALSKVFSVNFEEVYLYDTNKELLNYLKTRKDPFFNTDLKENILFSDNIEEHLKADIVVISSPVQTIKTYIKVLNREKKYIIASKGIDIEYLKTPLDLFLIENIRKENLFVLSGPTFAEEVILNKPTAIVLSTFFMNEESFNLQKLLNSSTFRVYLNDDPIGVSYGGALKNIIAIAAGISDGLDFGESARASLITRGLQEMIRLGVLFGAKEGTFYGLSGIGDLFLTASSSKSRNKRFGYLIGQGFSPEEALKEINQTVEGYYTIKSAFYISREKNIDLPITRSLYNVLYEGNNLEKEIKTLLSREPKKEYE